MDVKVYFEGRESGMMPYTSLPAFRLFCKQNGFLIKWDAKNRRIDLDSGLKGKTCVLTSGKMAGNIQYEREILQKVQKFLADAGIEAVLTENKPQISRGKDVSIRFTVKETRTAVKPKLILTQGENGTRKTLIDSLHKELKHTGIVSVVKAGKEPRFLHSGAEVQLQLPSGCDPSKRKSYGEKIAFYLASGILRYFQAGQHISSISCLPPSMMQTFFSSVLPEKMEKGREAAEIEAPRESEQTSELEAAQVSQHVTMQETILMPVDHPLQEEKRLEAEVFFDYTIFRSGAENSSFLLVGSLYVKNTGTEELYNPVVCLRASPAENIRLGGQILPPNLVEAMGVQTSSGMKGWRYMEDNWFSQAKERGEYWIAPIQPVRIPPGEMEPFQNFQISVSQPESGNTVTVEGFVFFHEQGLQCASNNRISLSF
ncbi:hypothetical protein O3V59_21220 [Brevibacillus thermoruber]|uniref:Uncharacterized protein n=1 Tax=Brevibacillus thermoruber TaxID=33942 RepID=A0A9X3TTX8_9BACL|nr:hypothetical protein [Brevibacillus thermoruber]MDA5110864.1 hypothetical protein [Brevibacillus thermoruber]